ncbi:MAG: tetratricopeptide repeat protein [Planctomycetota bacterium]|nr:tetratricopeptide repeat protein [Planctomycetota bacterium]
MSLSDVAIDIERALDSALTDSGEALGLRRRAVGAADLRLALRNLVDEGRQPAEIDETAAARHAAAHFILGQDSRVAEFADRANQHRVLFLWGLAEMYRNHTAKAAAVFARCVESEPRDVQARLQYASLLALLGDPEKATEMLGDLASDTERAPVLYALGTIAEANGDYEQAQQRYQSALMQDPEHVDSLFRLAYQHDLSGDDDAAIALYERARRVKPTRVNILINLGVLYEDRSEYEKAAEAYSSVLAQYPNHPRARGFMRDTQSSLSMMVDEDMERNEDRRNQLLRTPISDFELSVRSRNCLAKMNISSLGDLIQRTEAELLSYKNFGETSLQEIKDILGAKGLRLGMRRDEVLAEDLPAAPTLPDVPSEGPERSAALALPISDLDLSVRSTKCMLQLGVNTIGDLMQHTESELLHTKNFGVTSLQEIRTKLAKLGLNLTK